MDEPVQQRERARELAEAIRGRCLGTRVGHLHRVVARRFDRALRPVGLTLSQLEILTALVLFGEPVRPAAIAEALAIERSTMSRSLAIMEAGGLVVATRASAGGRSLAVTITPQGTRLLLRAEIAWTEAQAAATDLLGAEAPAIVELAARLPAS
jgi:DNA-binding MarR family transcriptional regulator